MTRVSGVASVLAVLALFATAAPSWAAGPVVSNAYVDLSGAVGLPERTDNVALSGLVHIVTRVVPAEDGKYLVTIFANLPANTSTEGPEGTQFIALGSSKHADVHDLGEIIPCVMPGFTLLQADPVAKGASQVPFDIRLELQFSPTGELQAGEARVGLR